MANLTLQPLALAITTRATAAAHVHASIPYLPRRPSARTRDWPAPEHPSLAQLQYWQFNFDTFKGGGPEGRIEGSKTSALLKKPEETSLRMHRRPVLRRPRSLPSPPMRASGCISAGALDVLVPPHAQCACNESWAGIDYVWQSSYANGVPCTAVAFAWYIHVAQGGPAERSYASQCPLDAVPARAKGIFQQRSVKCPSLSNQSYRNSEAGLAQQQQKKKHEMRGTGLEHWTRTGLKKKK
ncbi:hypothetical protein BDZ91DRAFT_784420 [Kalaharituber pfeilii]|nr:hypothetical protein BDZ91DRAFT_784420 [Kalaharituber pfeilii]